MTKLEKLKDTLSSAFNAMNNRDIQFTGFGLNIGLSLGGLVASGGALAIPIAVSLIGNALNVYNIVNPYQKKTVLSPKYSTRSGL